MKKRTNPSMGTSSTLTKCSCRTRRGATGLYYVPKDRRGKVVWVCAECFLPMAPGFNKYISRCDDCLDEFSSPWEDICLKCHRIKYSKIELIEGKVAQTPLSDAPPWQGWAHMARQEALGRQHRLTEARNGVVVLNDKLKAKEEISS